MLFERNADGLLIEVADTDDRRKGRRISRATFEADILFTPEEEAARDAEEARNAERDIERRAEAERKLQRKAEIAGRIGLTTADLEDLLK